MTLNFEETPQQHSSAESMSEKARDALNVLRRFRASHAPHPVFQSSRSRHNDTEVILDWSEK
ncbi:hypothetical protein [Boseongicola aestuarii]|uniref:Uncharacterized protein n=1 Tax=Boseongicola aestuarii TaxID=1470561 RepID=A0A238IXM5_9RHOB|nr:hypothetical protein [Boseongicola aestuarii]SMX23218.1 hypothetical protein BOA8489_01322 [Boseongicola aestuarii]